MKDAIQEFLTTYKGETSEKEVNAAQNYLYAQLAKWASSQQGAVIDRSDV